jgi:glutamate-1-semialdehyde aminotransferase
LIPGGTGLFGKREQLYCPGHWPTHFSKAYKCTVWDLAGKKYTDCTMVGIGTSILGYSNRTINRAVKKAIDNGSMSSLSCYEDCILAELLLDLHPWAEMARYTRTGGEAMTVAVRSARCATGRDLVLFNGYHGWHDWYLSSGRHNRRALDKALFTDVPFEGTPQYRQSVHFDTTDPANFDNVFSAYGDIAAACVIELVRDKPIPHDVLASIRRYCSQKGICLIFDEITSGFRKTLGGYHTLYSIYPDLCVFGKAISNGFAMGAIIGKREILDGDRRTFVSSTYWTERVGPSAAIATINEMRRLRTDKLIFTISEALRNTLVDFSSTLNASGLPYQLTFTDEPSLLSYNISSPMPSVLRSFLTKYMLDHNILASNRVYPTIHHTPRVYRKYFSYLLDALKLSAQIHPAKWCETFGIEPVSSVY